MLRARSAPVAGIGLSAVASAKPDDSGNVSTATASTGARLFRALVILLGFISKWPIASRAKERSVPAQNGFAKKHPDECAQCQIRSKG